MTGKVLLPCTDSTWLATVPAAGRPYEAAQRVVDLFVGATGLILFAPVILAAALAIAVDSPGGPFYWQERTGRYGRPFRIVKLRTMVQDAEPDGRPVWARERDPRVTRVGMLLRRTRIDALPQLWNIVRGEMSLIGPRPERPVIVEDLTREVPMYRARHVVRPGISGWAQVNYGYGSSTEDAFVKLQYDLYYVRHRSPLLDAIILLKTIGVVLRFRGR
jgi:lipopolysaccharide/colanic/teichoic acid biosynthesis glycosyltransferase